jgi:hypothetical protein
MPHKRRDYGSMKGGIKVYKNDFKSTTIPQIEVRRFTSFIKLLKL